MGTQALMEQMCFISRNAGLYIFSKMITQLLHRMKFYQQPQYGQSNTYKVSDAEESLHVSSHDLSPENCMQLYSFMEQELIRNRESLRNKKQHVTQGYISSESSKCKRCDESNLDADLTLPLLSSHGSLQTLATTEKPKPNVTFHKASFCSSHFSQP